MKIINEKPFSYLSHHGTKFESNRCDLCGGIEVKNAPKNRELFAVDLAEMISFHALHVWSDLNGFGGYDAINFIFTDSE